MNPLLEILPGFEFLIKGDTGTIDMEKGKTPVPNTLDERFGDGLRIACEKPCHKRCPVGEGHERGIERGIGVSPGRSLGLKPQRRTRRRLAFGKAVNRIIKKQIIDIDISPDDVREMSASYA